MNNSEIYTLDGDFEDYVGDSLYDVPFFRKELNLSNKGSNNEYKIAKILFETCEDTNNIVNVLGIGTEGEVTYVDYKKMNLMESNEDTVSIREDHIKNGLKNLHRLNIIYIDIKYDNFGYDNSSNEWCIFDFDSSGICREDKKSWYRKPPNDYNYNEVVRICKLPNSSMFNMGKIIEECTELFQECVGDSDCKKLLMDIKNNDIPTMDIMLKDPVFKNLFECAQDKDLIDNKFMEYYSSLDSEDSEDSEDSDESDDYSVETCEDLPKIKRICSKKNRRLTKFDEILFYKLFHNFLY